MSPDSVFKNIVLKKMKWMADIEEKDPRQFLVKDFGAPWIILKALPLWPFETPIGREEGGIKLIRIWQGEKERKKNPGR